MKYLLIIVLLTLSSCSSIPTDSVSEIYYYQKICQRKVLSPFKINGEQLEPNKSYLLGICKDKKVILPLVYESLNTLANGHIGRRYGKETWEIITITDGDVEITSTDYLAAHSPNPQNFPKMNFVWTYQTKECVKTTGRWKEENRAHLCKLDLLGKKGKVLASLNNVVYRNKGLVTYLNNGKFTSQYIDQETGNPNTEIVAVNNVGQLKSINGGIPLQNGEVWPLTKLGRRVTSNKYTKGYTYISDVKFKRGIAPYKVRYKFPNGTERWGFYRKEAEKEDNISARYITVKKCQTWMCGELPDHTWETIESEGILGRDHHRVYIYSNGKTINQALVKAHQKSKIKNVHIAKRQRRIDQNSIAHQQWLKRRAEIKAREKAKKVEIAKANKRRRERQRKSDVINRCRASAINYKKVSKQELNHVITNCSQHISTHSMSLVKAQFQHFPRNSYGSNSGYNASKSSSSSYKNSSRHQNTMRKHKQNMDQHRRDMNTLKRQARPSNR